MQVAVQERAHVFVSGGDVMFLEDAEHNSRVGHARDLDIMEIVIDSEPLSECKYQRVDARAAGVDQRAVDVEKQQPL